MTTWVLIFMLAWGRGGTSFAVDNFPTQAACVSFAERVVANKNLVYSLTAVYWDCVSK